MRRAQSLFLAVCAAIAAPCTALAWNADEVDFPGENNEWTLANDSTKYTGPDGQTNWFRYTETATNDNNDFDFKLVNGNDFNQDYGGNTTFPKNEFDIMFYQPLGDTPSKLAGGITSAYRYVYTVLNPGLVDTHISVMELSDDPANITNVSGGRGTFETNEAVKITIALDTNPPPEQKVYVRFTTDGFSSDSVVEATISNNIACVTFTNLELSAVYEWYALSSTASSNYLENTNGLAIDSLTLNWDNNSGSNYVFATPGEASFLWHNNNRVLIGSNAQMWVKMGYMNGDGSGKWVTNASVYYTTDGVEPFGGYGIASNGSTQVLSMNFSHTEQDAYQVGEAMWWVGTVTNLPGFTLIKYKIGAWYRDDLTERFADYGTGATNDATFTFQLGQLGDPELTVDGLSANYTTTKLFIDEIAGESEELVVIYKPGINDATIEAIEVFSNLDRRDFSDVDYSNAFITGDGYPMASSHRTAT